MRPVIAVVAALLAGSLLAQEAKAPEPPRSPSSAQSEVRLSLNEYQALRDANERPSATVIDTIRLTGTFRGLNITLIGRSVGKHPQTDVIDSTNDVTIAGCDGAGMVLRTAKGAFALIPLADKFEVKCDLRLSGSDRLQMHVRPSVLAVQSSVADGELVAGDEDESGGRSYSLVRQTSGGERLAATATGRYRITLLPDATRFSYAIDVHNPNRTTSTLALALVSNEHLQQIDSVAPYEVEGNRYVFTIPPGDSTIAMTGELRGNQFRAPVDASLQYLVIESHPLIRPAVETPAKRVSISETGITPQYRGALAFEAGTKQIAWQVTRLEALSAISYAVNSATHRFFVPLDGPILGETVFEVRNEGAADLELPSRPEPTFVSLQNEPLLMTKNRAGRLTVPLSTGTQTALVQHRQSFSDRLGVGVGRIIVPQLSVPASVTHVTMSYPAEWIPLYEGFSRTSILWTPEIGTILLFLILAIWIERVLSWLSVSLPFRMTIAFAGALAATIVATFLLVVIVACAALTVAWITTVSRLKGAGIWVAAGAATLFVLFVLMISNVGRITSKSHEYAVTDTSSVPAAPADAVTRQAQNQVREKEQTAGAAYQGLPAKFVLPAGSRRTDFSQELLRTDREQSVMVILVSIVLVTWIGVLIALAVVGALLRRRTVLVEAFRARLRASRENLESENKTP
jgi:hypothetical protein